MLKNIFLSMVVLLLSAGAWATPHPPYVGFGYMHTPVSTDAWYPYGHYDYLFPSALTQEATSIAYPLLGNHSASFPATSSPFANRQNELAFQLGDMVSIWGANTASVAYDSAYYDHVVEWGVLQSCTNTAGGLNATFVNCVISNSNPWGAKLVTINADYESKRR